MAGDGRQDDDGARRVRPRRRRVAHFVRMATVFLLLELLLAVVLPATLGATRSLTVFWAIAMGALTALLMDEARRRILFTVERPADDLEMPDAA